VDIGFQAGDIVIDMVTEEIGLLIERFDILEHASKELRGRVFAWEILWTGAGTTSDTQYVPYTEHGLIKCIKDKLLMHISSE
tara:strand:- start:318 stop:563 length:246 start_codon:yes stop_codon:yes gene_type:complete